MPKLSLRNRLLHLRISTYAVVVLSLIAVERLFTSCSIYDYNSVPREQLTDAIYTATVPLTKAKLSQPHCPYDHILQDKNRIQNWEVPRSSKEIGNFSAQGIVDGSFMPENCQPMFSVAILVTYRNRQRHLDVFLPYMHNFLRKQNIHYKIYLIEQLDEKPWNKGVLYNIGAKYAIADKFPCLVLHDVDLLPLDAANLYVCMAQPRHVSASIDKFRFVLIYDWLVGGVMAIRSDQYISINGFSNSFQNWGGEDDDLADRILSNNLDILRFPRDMSEYTMLTHSHEPVNSARESVMQENKMLGHKDGMNSVKYDSVQVKAQRLCTWIGVKL
ncbi:beta-1,4-N-acetylgalactosaminyltransferase bre-4 [Amyelois transitella]|uniref:beta-1,4-N-acetylgalactosaminyltransferase bre-4 n=1 Tax=Amyelois transitella TaxID=680683 RepID=UPI00067CFC7A|nr:beta-1,4-N-acetylgalactosaminyltransferase bre-4 [Amyelois transitella]XP_060803023.1 beta-1,4-N-acetylgalactosaminyltransferase bre-4 [Amyelois transitella]